MEANKHKEDYPTNKRVPRRRILVDVAPGGIAPIPEAAKEGASVNRDTSVKSKILSHFIKGKISLSPMETILMIPGELEHLENLRMTSEALMRDVAVALKSTHLNGASDVATRNPYLYDPILPKQVDAPMSDSDNETNDEEHYDERSQLAELHNDENEFGNIEFENLVLAEGPQQILQLIF
ncbi:unnamed protein product [Sphagnum jensenii]|uniref:Uncharacterized protein n=1 Tax=Sphagnum jensenii TaxID=128206 RepID=A0ABP1A4I6_9BRYO